MKKLLLTLGTVAAVAAPVASVVACGTTNEVANPEFQAVSVKGFTFDKDKVPYLTTDFKGFVEVVIGANRYLVPANDIKEEVTTAATAEVLNEDGTVATAAKPAGMTYTVVSKSVTSKDTRITGTIKSVIKGKHTVLAEADQVKLINAGKPGEVIVKAKDEVEAFLTGHETTTTADKVSAVLTDGKFVKDGANYIQKSPLSVIVDDFYASTFKAADDAAALKTHVTAAIKVIRGTTATDKIKKLIKDVPADAAKSNPLVKAKRAELVKQVQGAASLEAINLILFNDGLITTALK